MDWVPKKSPLKHGLFVRRPLSNLLLRFLNFLERPSPQPASLPRTPKKILLSNLASFGDVVIATNVLPILKKHFPKTQIGFLAASGPGSAILQKHPLVDRVHLYDHRYFVSSSPSASFHQAFKEICAEDYEIAIDLYPYFPNAIPLFSKSRIPMRIGYPTGGFSNQLTHPVPWTFQDRYVGFAHLRLLEELGIDTQQESPLPCYFFKKQTGNDVVVNMGSSTPLKEWDVHLWIDLIQRLEAIGWTIRLTGKGSRQQAFCAEVASKTKASNVCDLLDWDQFVVTIQEAKLVITVDSSAVQIAAAASTPTVVLFAGMNSPHMWLPPFSQCKGIMHKVPCAPCFNKKGCATRDCIQKITVEEVYQTAVQLHQEFAWTSQS